MAETVVTGIRGDLSSLVIVRKRRIWALSLALTVVLITATLLSFERNWLFNSDIVAYSRNLPKDDKVDVPLLLGSLDRKPTFASTFSWWHESWVPTVPFWRPLTIQTFWLEKHLFTTDRYDLWMWLSFVLDGACVAGFGFFVNAFTGRRDVALIAVLLYGVARPALLTSFDLGPAPALLALDAWKNQPDLWTDMLIFIGMSFTVLGRYWAALACCILSVCFKEGGWFSFLLCAAVVAYRREYGKITPMLVVSGVASVVALVALRWSAGHAVMEGYRLGSNVNWFARYDGVVEGFAIRNAAIDQTSGVLGAGLLLIGLNARRMNLIALLLSCLALLLAASGAESWRLHINLSTGLALILDPSAGGSLLKIGLISGSSMLVIYCLVRNESLRLPALFALACALMTALSFAAATQVQVHVLHLATAFQSWLLGLALVATWEALVGLKDNRVSRPLGHKIA